MGIGLCLYVDHGHMGLIFFLFLSYPFLHCKFVRHFLTIGGIKAAPSPPPNFLRGTIPHAPLSLRPWVWYCKPSLFAWRWKDTRFNENVCPSFPHRPKLRMQLRYRVLDKKTPHISFRLPRSDFNVICVIYIWWESSRWTLDFGLESGDWM